MQQVNDRFKKELDTFVDFLDQKYAGEEMYWDLLYVEDDFAYLVFVYDKEHKKVLGTFSLNYSSAHEPQLDLDAYKTFIKEVMDKNGVKKIES